MPALGAVAVPNTFDAASKQVSNPLAGHSDREVRDRDREAALRAGVANILSTVEDQLVTMLINNSSFGYLSENNNKELESHSWKGIDSPGGATASSQEGDEVMTPAGAHTPASYSALALVGKARSVAGSSDPRTSRQSMGSRMSFLSHDRYELLPFWTDANVMKSSSMKNLSSDKGKFVSPTKSYRKAAALGDQPPQRGPFGISPVSNRRIFWEGLGMVFIFYDLLMTPFQAISENAMSASLIRDVITYMILGYWTLDVPCSFIVGFSVNGVMELRIRETAANYLRTWFVPDIMLLFSDYLFVALEVLSDTTGAEHLTYVKAVRAMRIFKFVKLFRLLKLHSFSTKITHSVYSEHILTMMHVSKFILCIVIVNHYIACAWYFIGTIHEEESWVNTHFDEYDTVLYRYTTSLHWALTQFTPASMEVNGKNPTERIFTVFVIVGALVAFSSFVSSITEAMTHLRKVNSRKTSQYTTLRRYLGENSISADLAMRVWRYLEEEVHRKPARNMWQDVELLKEMPEVLQTDLREEIYLPTISQHPFFHQYGEANQTAMRALVFKAVQEVSLVTDQDLFNVGQVANGMHFHIEGCLEYSTFRYKQNVDPGNWFSEAALWLRWVHRGTMVALKLSIVFTLRTSCVHDIFQQYPDQLPKCQTFAEMFVEYANDVSDMSDVNVDVDGIRSYADMCFHEPPEQEERQQLVEKKSISSQSNTESNTSSLDRTSTSERTMVSSLHNALSRWRVHVRGSTKSTPFHRRNSAESNISV